MKVLQSAEDQQNFEVEEHHPSTPQWLPETKIKFMIKRWNIYNYFLHKTKPS